MISHRIANQIRDKIDNAERVMIVPHRGPDGDALGSLLGLKKVLEEKFHKEVIPIVDSVERLPQELSFLPGFSSIRDSFKNNEADLVIFVDHNEFSRTGFHRIKPNWEQSVRDLVIIDHHETLSEPRVPDAVVLSNPQSPSTTMLLHELFQLWDVNITADLATCLLLGIITDTDSFRNTNTTPEAMDSASELVRIGADRRRIFDDFVRVQRAKSLLLWGRAMSNLRVTKNRFAVTSLRQKDFVDLGISEQEDFLTGLANSIIRSVEGIRAGFLFVEKDFGVKVSMRTAPGSDFDVARVAELFGGGGHIRSAGFFLPGKKLQQETSFTFAEKI